MTTFTIQEDILTEKKEFKDLSELYKFLGGIVKREKKTGRTKVAVSRKIEVIDPELIAAHNKAFGEDATKLYFV